MEGRQYWTTLLRLTYAAGVVTEALAMAPSKGSIRLSLIADQVTKIVGLRFHSRSKHLMSPG